MIPAALKHEILIELESLNPQQTENVMNYIRGLIISRKQRSKTFKRKAMEQIRKAIKKGL